MIFRQEAVFLLKVDFFVFCLSLFCVLRGKLQEIYLYDKNKNCTVYIVTDNFIVEPDEVWVLDDFGDNRITIITCTDDGLQRQVVVGKLLN